MIGVVFDFAGDIIEVRVDGFNLSFRNNQTQGALYPIEALRLDKKGVIKEFPELENDEEWRKKSLENFKNKLRELDKEEDRVKYIINDLGKFGYKPLYMQKRGFRSVKIN